MKVNGTLVNYYFHCKRQCYLHGNRLNLEDESENVKIGKAIHEEKYDKENNCEIAIDNIRLDKLTTKYLTEIKKSGKIYSREQRAKRTCDACFLILPGR